MDTYTHTYIHTNINIQSTYVYHGNLSMIQIISELQTVEIKSLSLKGNTTDSQQILLEVYRPENEVRYLASKLYYVKLELITRQN